MNQESIKKPYNMEDWRSEMSLPAPVRGHLAKFLLTGLSAA